MNVKMRMRGTQEFADALNALPAAVKVAVLGNAVAEITGGMAADMKAAAPRDEGDLADSISWKELESKGTRAKAAVGVGKPGWYWFLVEWGVKAHTIRVSSRRGRKKVLADGRGGEVFGKVVQHPGAAPHPFVRPAFDRWRRKTRRVLRKHFEAAVGVTMRKARQKAVG